MVIYSSTIPGKTVSLWGKKIRRIVNGEEYLLYLASALITSQRGSSQRQREKSPLKKMTSRTLFYCGYHKLIYNLYNSYSKLKHICLKQCEKNGMSTALPYFSLPIFLDVIGKLNVDTSL